ncbi:MAG: hypothetical protein P1V81_06405 [Planctomycetota bacterium]|nr:hypothetical protein [Planctomycetota bacterium]
MSLLLAPLFALVLQGPLNVHQPGPSTGYGLAVAVSDDGAELLQARGPELWRLDFARIRAEVRAPAGDSDTPSDAPSDAPFEVHDALLQRVALDVPIRALRSLPGGGVLVAGGDGGLLFVGRDGGQRLLDEAPDGRWCVDLDLTPEHLVVLWSGWDDSLLRSYDLAGLDTTAREDRAGAPAESPRARTGGAALDTPLTQLGEARLRSRSSGGDLRHPANGLACRVHDGQVYVAMGGSGVARVALSASGELGAVEQGPVFHPEAGAERARRERFRARDLDIAGGVLYVAADEAGLVVLPLDALERWTEQTPYTRHGQDPGPAHRSSSPSFLRGPGYRSHAVRVEAELDDRGRTLVAVGALPTTSAEVEWGPYRSYTTFTWDLRPAAIAPDPAMKGKGVHLQLFERRADGQLVPGSDHGSSRSASHGASPRSGARLHLAQVREITDLPQVWAGLAMHIEPGGRAWFVDHALTMQHVERADGELQPIVPVPVEMLADDRPLFTLYTTASFSRVDPSVLFTAVDGWETLPHLRLVGSYPNVALEPIPGSESLRLPVFVQGSWIEAPPSGGPAPPEEWLVAGMDSPWILNRVRHTAEGLDIASWELPFDVAGEQPCGTDGGRGRSYAAAAIDPASDLIALSRSSVDHGVSLYSRAALVAAARAQEVQPMAARQLTACQPLGHLDTNPEVTCDYAKSLAFRSGFFPWRSGEDESVLAIAAGSYLDPRSPHYQLPKLALLRVDPAAHLTTGSPPSAVPGSTNTTLLVGSGRRGLAFSFAIAELEGTQYAFVGDSVGGLAAFDLTGAFGGAEGEPFTVLGEVARWDLPRSTLDGLGAPLTDVIARTEVKGARREASLHLYVAASRWGVARLAVTSTGDPRAPLAIELAERLATPMQASGLTLTSMPETGEPVLAVSDHDGTTVRLYTEAP